MRPTDLKFRNPRERTPDPYDTTITSNGTTLFECKRKTKSTFSQAKRFQDNSSDKLGFRLGPGSYDLSVNSIARKKVRGVPGYKPLHGGKDLATNAYYYIGNNLVYDPKIVLGNKNKLFRDCSVEVSFINKTRPTTASSRNYSSGIRKFMTPQPFDDRPASALDNKTR